MFSRSCSAAFWAQAFGQMGSSLRCDSDLGRSSEVGISWITDLGEMNHKGNTLD